MTGLGRMEEEANDAGFFKQRVAGVDNRKTEWKVVCTRCGASDSHQYGPTTSAHLMVKNARNKGWAVGHKVKPLCGQCKHCRGHSVADVANALFNGNARIAGVPKVGMTVASRSEALKQKALLTTGDAAVWDAADAAIAAGREMDELKETVKMVQAVASDINESIIKRMARVQKRLEAAFDPASRTYRDGLTDEKLAKELKVSVESLAEIRLEFFGELAEDPRFTEFRAECVALRQEVSKLTDSLAATDAKAAHLLTRFEHWIVNRKLSGRP